MVETERQLLAYSHKRQNHVNTSLAQQNYIYAKIAAATRLPFALECISFARAKQGQGKRSILSALFRLWQHFN